VERKDEKVEGSLTEKEKKLIAFLRQIGYGRVVIFLENGQPMRIEEGIKSTKL